MKESGYELECRVNIGKYWDAYKKAWVIGAGREVVSEQIVRELANNGIDSLNYMSFVNTMELHGLGVKFHNEKMTWKELKEFKTLNIGLETFCTSNDGGYSKPLVNEINFNSDKELDMNSTGLETIAFLQCCVNIDIRNLRQGVINLDELIDKVVVSIGINITCRIRNRITLSTLVQNNNKLDIHTKYNKEVGTATAKVKSDALAIVNSIVRDKELWRKKQLDEVRNECKSIISRSNTFFKGDVTKIGNIEFINSKDCFVDVSRL